MSTKIGEVLIEAGLVSRSQLDHGLRLQLIFGGHLGTCLTELGYVDAADLARTLSATLGMKCARAEVFQDIPTQILRKIPRDEVRRRLVVPFGVRRDALHVAVLHPRSITGLSAKVGQRIVPYLAPESYILRAMERYYGVPRRRRYLTVPYASAGVPNNGADGSPGKASGTAGASATNAGLSPAANTLDGDGSLRLGEHSRRMSQVDSHAELGEIMLDFAGERTERAILFYADSEGAGVANWRGVELETQAVTELRLPLEARSIFGLALEESWYRGALPGDFNCGSFYGKLGMAVPREILVLPIYGDNRLEVVLYADGGSRGQVTGPDDRFAILADEVGLALRMLSFKRQLCPA